MHERMLNKTQTPTFEQMLEVCGASARLWLELEGFLRQSYDLQTQIRFPYGNSYGWSVKYARGKKHICDVFAESGAFTVFFRVDNKQIEALSGTLCDYTKTLCDKKYPCDDGGWVRLRVTEPAHLSDAEKLLAAKVKPKDG